MKSQSSKSTKLLQRGELQAHKGMSVCAGSEGPDSLRRDNAGSPASAASPAQLCSQGASLDQAGCNHGDPCHHRPSSEPVPAAGPQGVFTREPKWCWLGNALHKSSRGALFQVKHADVPFPL